MAVRVRNKENGVVVGVSEIVAEGLCVSDEFERVEDEQPESKPKPARRASAKKAAADPPTGDEK